MPIDLAVPVLADLTIQQVARRTGLSESALRYYERIGLLDPVPRDPSSGHRRYPPELVTAVESLACLRGTGMSVRDMRTYVDNMRGPDSAADQQRLFAAHAQRLGDEISRLQVRRRYVAAKADMWAARQRGDSDAEQRLIPEIIALGNQLLEEEATHHD
jgi:DNA-binding transcriptional MerR regulator